MTSAPPRISAIIPTRDRASLLRGALESLGSQTLPERDFEVVVVDDGGTDQTPQVCRDLSLDLQLRMVRIGHSGIAAAKNLGLFVSRGPISLFFDDDDVAAPNLLEAHLDAHDRHPEDGAAVLGFTTWAPRLEVRPVMRYVTGPGAFLFSYGNLTPGQMLDFTYFWGGRSSCKRSFLATNGIFNQSFLFGCEDIELAYRLSRFGFRVFYERDAVSYMNRPVTFEEFCRRCERQGWSQFHFSRLHPDPRIQEYCEVTGAHERWTAEGGRIDELVRRVQELEQTVEATGLGEGGATLDELHASYREIFLAYKARGIVRAARTAAEGSMPSEDVEMSPDVPGSNGHGGRTNDTLLTQGSRGTTTP